MLVLLCFYFSALCGGVGRKSLAYSKCSNKPSPAFMPQSYAGQFVVPRNLETSSEMTVVGKPHSRRLDGEFVAGKSRCRREFET